MYYRIHVYDDGDVVVSKHTEPKAWDSNLYLDSIEELREELADYGVDNLDAVIQEIQKADLAEEIECT